MNKIDIAYESIRAKSAGLIRHKLFHPQKENHEIVALSEEFADLWPSWIKTGNLEAEVNAWLRKLDLSHTGFWRGAGSRIPPYFAINAILKRMDDGRLIFWDILPGGIAERVGIRPGDVLLGIDGQEIGAAEPRFRLEGQYRLAVLRNGTEKTIDITLPGVRPKDRPPMTQAKPLSVSTQDRIGILKLTSFPGAIGFDLTCYTI